MFGFKIISQYALDEQLNNARRKGEKNSLATIQRLNDKVAEFSKENICLLNERSIMKDQYQKNVSMMNKAMLGESELRTAIRELIEVYNAKAPKISITNEDLIKEMKALTSENFKTFTKQAQLLVDVAENKDVASITAIEEYLATFHFNIDEEFSNQNTENNGIN